MGLDITAYSGLKFVRQLQCDEENDSELIEFYVHPSFPGRAEKIKPNSLYSAEKKFEFRAGSYGGYNEWRDQLASLFGSVPQDYWSGKKAGPFAELINFADNEGTIGSITSAKLAKDFAEYDERAKAKFEAISLYAYKLFQDWRKAFELASNDGAVKFH